MAKDFLIVIGARLNSSRLPKKHLLPLAGKPLIHRIFERLESSSVNADIVLATTADDYNKPLVDWAVANEKLHYTYKGDVNDLVGRVDAVVDIYKPRKLIYICGDCPLIDPKLIEMIYGCFQENPNLDSVIVPKLNGKESLHEGILPYSYDAWKKLVVHSQTELQREHVGLAFSQLPAPMLVELTLPEGHYKEGVRLSVDTKSDHLFMEAIYSSWYAVVDQSHIVDFDWFLSLIDTEPERLSINSHVMQKSGLCNYSKACVVAECSGLKGIGQLRRSVAVAERLIEETGMGVEVLILGDSRPLDFLRYVNYEWYDDEIKLLDKLALSEVGIVFLDVFPSRLQYRNQWTDELSRLQSLGRASLIALDRGVSLEIEFDVAVIPAIYFDKSSSYKTDSSKVFWGSEYIVSECRQWVPASDCQLTVLTGGSDAFGYGEWLPEFLNKYLPNDLSVMWISGPYSKDPVIPYGSKLNWSIVRNPDDLLKVVANSHSVLSVYGVSMWEALSIGIPTAYLMPDNLISEAEELAFSELEVALPFSFDEKGISNIEHILFNSSERERLIENLKSLRLGEGSANIVGRIVNA